MYTRRIILIALLYPLTFSGLSAENPFEDEDDNSVCIVAAESIEQEKGKCIKVIIENWDVDAFGFLVEKTDNTNKLTKLIYGNDQNQNQFYIPRSFRGKTNDVEITLSEDAFFKEVLARFKVNFYLHEVLRYEIPKSSQHFLLSEEYSAKHHYKSKDFILFKLEGVNKDIYTKRWLIFERKEKGYECKVPYLMAGKYNLSLVSNKSDKIVFGKSRQIQISDFKIIKIEE